MEGTERNNAMPAITLENDLLRVCLDPDRGTSILAFYARKGDDWLPLMPDVRAEDSRLDAASFLMIPYSNRIPSGPAQPLTAEQDYSVEKGLDPDRFWDACFQGYDGNSHITWPESSVRLTFACSPECQHLIVYNPPFPVFAVEPVTNANNGVNLYAAGWPNSGVVVLEPGECLTARFDLQVDIAP
jgi:galactose mutarotase-like enzyme